MAAKELTTTWDGQDKPEPVSVVDLYSRLEGHKNQAWAQRQWEMIKWINGHRPTSWEETETTRQNVEQTILNTWPNGAHGTCSCRDVTDAHRNQVVKLVLVTLGVYTHLRTNYRAPSNGTLSIVEHDAGWQDTLKVGFNVAMLQRLDSERQRMAANTDSFKAAPAARM